MNLPIKKIDELVISERTKQNILRKSEYVDLVQMLPDGLPLFSWIDLSITELCNRLCEFCPRVDSGFYPNQNLHMSISLIQKVANELQSLNYKGGVVLCGYGEPLLHPQIIDIIGVFDKSIRTELVTNGDKLDEKMISALYDKGLSYMCVSMYDGPWQVDRFKKLFNNVGVSEDRFILRDRWHDESDEFGLKLTNRGGTLQFGPPTDDYKTHPCFYLAYSMAIDWNGDALLCVQDWNKKVKLGNLNTDSLLNIWKSPQMEKLRHRLMSGNRKLPPCNGCNADGTLHGHNHVNSWIDYDKRGDN
jgi:radical SAM protein with 4Fe4S-binding SPASM domain